MTHKRCPACGNGLDDNGDHFYCPGCCQAFTPEQVASRVVRQPEGAGIFAASYELVAMMLGLPPDVRIVGVRDEGWSRQMEIAVRGPGLPACKVGELLPRVRAIATAEAGGKPAVSFETVQTEADMLRAEVARLRKLVEDDGR